MNTRNHLESAPPPGEIPGQASEEVDAMVTAALESAARAREGLAMAAQGPKMIVAPKNVGRVTGWIVFCPKHGAMDHLAPSQSAAVAASAAHLEEEHGKRGSIVKGRIPKKKGAHRAA